VEAVSKLSYDQATAEYGSPRFEDGTLCPYTVCAVGKCGGREMGFASDLELLILYETNGRTSGPNPVTNAEFFDRMVRLIKSGLHAKRDGIFEVDLRLRPYGSAGSLAVSLASYRRYFAPGGPAWPYERQTLIKLRPITGDTALGRHVVEIRDEILTSMGGFESAPMRAMRQRQIRHLVRPGTINVKYSPGALVDLEYLVQGLQINYCRRSPELLQRTGTREAMRELESNALLAPEHREQLDQAYILFRRLIEALRMVRGNARDLTLPEVVDSASSYLSRRLGYDEPGDLRAELTASMERVRYLNTKLLG
jgi:glutamate-ammonia-ligase adenylyltransferase